MGNNEGDDIRWKQRFSNFEKAFIFLQKAVQLKKYDALQAAGLVQAFEFTFELSWKTLKDYLSNMGIYLNFPREILKEAYHSELIEDGHLWICMLEQRNILTHTYNEEQAQKAVKIICEEYFPAINQVYQKLKGIYQK